MLVLYSGGRESNPARPRGQGFESSAPLPFRHAGKIGKTNQLKIDIAVTGFEAGDGGLQTLCSLPCDSRILKV